MPAYGHDKYFAYTNSLKTVLSIFTRCALAWSIMFTCSDAFAHFVLPLNVNEVSNDTINLEPGDTLFVLAGQRQFLTLRNFLGTEEQPIVVLNSEGKVHVHSTNNLYYQQGINIKHCEHISVIGNGDPKIRYGFEVSQTLIGSGVDIRELSGGIEIAHVQIHHTDFAGIIAKDDPDCTGRFSRENFLMKPLNLHHNYIHHTAGEGLYLGSTSYEGLTTVCDGKQVLLKPHLIESVELAFNRFEFTGREAIQVFSSLGKVWLHHNSIEEYAVNQEASHSNGITLGLGTAGEASHNFISKGYGHGVAITGSAWTIHNNVIVDAGNLVGSPGNILACGIYMDEANLKSGKSMTVANNTVVRSRHNGIRLVSNGHITSKSKWSLKLRNNLFAGWGTGNHIYGPKDTTPIYLWKFSRAQIRTQLNFKTLENAGFVDEVSGDFSLKEESEGINMGVPLETVSPLTDFEGRQRTVGAFIDIGAYEHPVSALAKRSGHLGSCDQIFYPESAVLNGKYIEHTAGDTFCLARGDWSLLKISNFQGSDKSPVVFTNYDGRLQFKDVHVGLQLEELTHVDLSRINGDSSPWYLSNIHGDAVVLKNCEDVHLSHLSVKGIENHGIRISSTQKDVSTNRINALKGFELSYSCFEGIKGWWVVYLQGAEEQVFNDVNLHHNHFRDNKGGAIYGGQVQGQVQVWKNEFYHHTGPVFHFENCQTINLYANRVRKAPTSILELDALEQVYVHNNIFEADTNNLDGLVHVMPGSYPIPDFQLVNNTVILTEGTLVTGHDAQAEEIYNNLLVLKGEETHVYSSENAGFNLMLHEDWKQEFIDFDSGDFRPRPNSMINCLGAEIKLDFMRVDFTLKQRSGNTAVGAFDLHENVQPSSRLKHMSIYPNPSTNVLQIELDGEPLIPLLFEVYGQNGDVLQKGFIYTCLTEIQLEELPSGQYFLRVHQSHSPETISFTVIRN